MIWITIGNQENKKKKIPSAHVCWQWNITACMRQFNSNYGPSAVKETLWLMQSLICHIIFSSTPTLPQSRDMPGHLWRTALSSRFPKSLISPATQVLANSLSHHNCSIQQSQSLKNKRACSYLFKLSETVHLYRWAFVCLITWEICTGR